MDLLGLAALALVAVEWLAIGYLSGVRWPGPVLWAARWSLSLLVGAFLIGLAELLLSLIDFGFGSIPLVLVVAAVCALIVRVVASGAAIAPLGEAVTRRERYAWLLLALVLAAAT